MTNAIFISEDYLKENSIINGNVDAKYLLANLKTAEDVYIHPVLGSNMYDELKTQITGGALTANNRILMEEYIQPALMYWLQVILPLDMVFKWENKSIVKKSSENSTPIETADIKFIMNEKRHIANFYTERLALFLRANITLYPAFATWGATIDKMKPQASAYKYGGVYLGDRRKDYRDIPAHDRYQGNGVTDL